MYVHRRIRVTVANAQAFGPGAVENTPAAPSQGGKTVEGLRTIARISKAGGQSMANAEIIIYGLSKQAINQLSTWGTMYRPLSDYKIAVEAGDDRNGMSTVFLGTVYQAWADFTNMPDVPMYLLAVGTTAAMNAGTTDPTSTSGATPIAPLVSKLAKAGGMTFENNGVNAVLNGVYHWGSPWKQIKEICEACNVHVYQDDGVVTAWPDGQTRQGGALLVSKETGMRDEPIFTQFGLVVKVEFSRSIKFGTTMTVKSEVLQAANGTWWIAGIDYDLAAELPNGNWFAILSGIQVGAPVSVLPSGVGGGSA